MGFRASKVLIEPSLEQVWIVRGLYLFQSKKRTSACGWAWIIVVAKISLVGVRGDGRLGCLISQRRRVESAEQEPIVWGI